MTVPLEDTENDYFTISAAASPDCTWLDTARVARRAWCDHFGQSGYGLANVCDYLGYDFGHHDALEDAKAAGHILLSTVRETGIGVGDWFKRVDLPIGSDTKGHTREGSAEGSLHEEVLVFSGALEMPRWEAADLAAQAGCNVVANVSKKNALLVVGESVFAGVVNSQ